MNEVYEFLKAAGTYFLATVDGDAPRVRPFGTIDLFDGKLFIQTGKKKDVSKQMKANGQVEICAMSGGKWIRLTANACLVDSRAARVHMLDAYPELKSMYDPDDGNTEVFALTNATATVCSFTEPAKIYKF